MSQKWTLLLAASLLAACNDNSGGQPTTIRQALETLEISGALPVLDRDASVSGIDANADGVRDDIAQYIDSKPDSRVQKISLKSFSRSLTRAMTVDTNDQNALRTVANSMNAAVSCIWKAYPSSTASSMVREIEKLTVNTRGRYDAYMQFNSAMDGSVLKNEREANCD